MARAAALSETEPGEAQAHVQSLCDKLYADLMAATTDPTDPALLTLAGVISLAPARPAAYQAYIHGLPPGELPLLLQTCFPGVSLPDLHIHARPGDVDEFDDLLGLLLEHRGERSRRSRWLAHAVATAAMGNNHLWQDLGLASRALLSGLMNEHFTALAQKNVGDMKWKKFFYRQLCEQEEILICRSPHCAVCDDYSACFSKEEGKGLLALEVVAV